MPLAFAPATTAQLASGRSAERDMILFDFPSGLWGFWSDLAPMTWNGVTYVGAGSLVQAANIQESTDLASRKLTLTLRSIPDTGLTPDVLATIENETYHQRPVTLMTAFLDPDTGALVSVEVRMRGLVDRITHKDDANGAALECAIETRTRDITKRGTRRRTHADQQRIDPTDDGLKYVTATPDQTIVFGRLDNATQAWKDAALQRKADRKKKSWF